jgi:hypothetical protein
VDRPEASPKPIDWVAWHHDYDNETPLRRRLEIVQRWIRTTLIEERGSPIRVISMCAGEARDLLGAVEMVERRDIVGRLVEIDPQLAVIARSRALELGLKDLEIAVGDAGHMGAYSGATPADLVLACGVFGNISDEDIERTLRALPQLCAPRATVIWTRHRRPPDLTPSIRRWLAESDFEDVCFEPVPESTGTVGIARYRGQPRGHTDQRLFTFNRTDTDFSR